MLFSILETVIFCQFHISQPHKLWQSFSMSILDHYASYLKSFIKNLFNVKSGEFIDPLSNLYNRKPQNWQTLLKHGHSYNKRELFSQCWSTLHKRWQTLSLRCLRSWRCLLFRHVFCTVQTITTQSSHIQAIALKHRQIYADHD